MPEALSISPRACIADRVVPVMRSVCPRADHAMMPCFVLDVACKRVGAGSVALPPERACAPCCYGGMSGQRPCAYYTSSSS